MCIARDRCRCWCQSQFCKKISLDNVGEGVSGLGQLSEVRQGIYSLDLFLQQRIRTCLYNFKLVIRKTRGNMYINIYNYIYASTKGLQLRVILGGVGVNRQYSFIQKGGWARYNTTCAHTLRNLIIRCTFLVFIFNFIFIFMFSCPPSQVTH